MSRHSPAVGAPCWFELSSSDSAASLAFHQALFGWSSESHDMGEMGSYTFVRNSTGTVGAICGLPPGTTAPSNWGVYFAVSSVDASVQQAQALGARLLFDPFDVPGHGRGAVLTDPTGAVFSLWQSAQADAGDFTMFENHSVGWVELASRDATAAQIFYSTLLGWSCNDSMPLPGGGHYSEYSVADQRYGGIMPMDQHWGDIPSHWSIYIPVADIASCLERVAELGGKVCVPPFDVPGVGRIARIDDPAGAGAYVIQLQQPAS